jgi:hypothetical protein
MTTLAGITLKLAKVLGNVTTGTATGGSATTLVDTGRTEALSYWNNGAIWITSGTYSGLSRAITSWTLSTNTFAFPTVGGTIVAGVTYSVIEGAPLGFSRSVLQNAINTVLNEVKIPTLDVSTTTVANQMSYTLPAGSSDLRRVEVATSLSSPYEYQEHNHWWNNATTLYFDERSQPDTAGYIIRLTYMAAHSELTDTDSVNALVNDNWLMWAAAIHALRWKMQRTKNDDPVVAQMLNEAIANEAKYAARFPLPRYDKKPHYPVWDAGSEKIDSDVNLVRI